MVIYQIQIYFYLKQSTWYVTNSTVNILIS